MVTTDAAAAGTPGARRTFDSEYSRQPDATVGISFLDCTGRCKVNFPITSYEVQYQRVDDNDDDDNAADIADWSDAISDQRRRRLQ